MSRVKVAIVGAGWVTENCYLPHLGPDGPLEAAAVYDLDAERAGRLAVSLGLPRPARDVAECLDSSIRGVIICTPTHTHLPLVLRALEAGRYVLCEKPVARDEEGADVLRATPAAASRLMGSATTRLRRDVELLMSWVRSGRVGEVRRIASGWWRGRGVPASESWHTDTRACPAGVLEDLGPHLLDVVAALLPTATASPENVESTLECRYGTAGRVADWYGAIDAAARRAYETPDYAHASVDFAGGTSLELEVCWASEEQGDLSEIVVEGEKGTASLRGLFGFSTSRREPRQVCTLVARGRADEVVEFTPGPQGQREAFGRSVKTFAQFCAGEGPPVAGLQEVLKVASLLAAVRRHASLSPVTEALV